METKIPLAPTVTTIWLIELGEEEKKRHQKQQHIQLLEVPYLQPGWESKGARNVHRSTPEEIHASTTHITDLSV